MSLEELSHAQFGVQNTWVGINHVFVIFVIEDNTINFKAQVVLNTILHRVSVRFLCIKFERRKEDDK